MSCSLSALADAPMPEAVLNPQALASLRQLQPHEGDAFVARVLEGYLRSLDRHHALARQNWALQQEELVASSAHALRSASASVGAVELARLCERVEQAVRQQQHGELAQCMPGFLSELERVTAAVHTLLADRSESPHSVLPTEER